MSMPRKRKTRRGTGRGASFASNISKPPPVLDCESITSNTKSTSSNFKIKRQKLPCTSISETHISVGSVHEEQSVVPSVSAGEKNMSLTDGLCKMKETFAEATAESNHQHLNVSKISSAIETDTNKLHKISSDRKSTETGTAGQQFLIILIGLPGSGKSTIAERIRKYENNWLVVCQDILKRRQVCQRLTNEHIISGGNVIVDRTNVSYEQREHFLGLYGVRTRNVHKIALILLDPSNQDSYYLCLQRCLHRVGHPTLHKGISERRLKGILTMLRRRYQHPILEEGFDTIIHYHQQQQQQQQPSDYDSPISIYDLLKPKKCIAENTLTCTSTK